MQWNRFDAVVVDECQDLSPAQLRFLSRLTAHEPGGLFFTGDLGQRIFQTPFSWLSLGVDTRGRSRMLKINYRTSHQIRRQADRLLDPTLTDVDGNEEHRDGTISVFNGPPPAIHTADSEDGETDFVAQWLLQRVDEGVAAAEIGFFARTEAHLARAREAIRKACDVSGKGLGGISLATMHAATSWSRSAAVSDRTLGRRGRGSSKALLHRIARSSSIHCSARSGCVVAAG